MEFRKTTEADLPALQKIFDDARETMHAAGIDQWTNGYPALSDIRADMAADTSYVLEDNGTIAATAAILLNGEETYTVIENGQWLTVSSDDENTTYAAVHRIATARALRGQGIASRMIYEASVLAKKAGKKSLRIDTHRDNRPMQGMLARNGFTMCGIITLKSGAPRNAYEKLL